MLISVYWLLLLLDVLLATVATNTDDETDNTYGDVQSIIL